MTSAFDTILVSLLDDINKKKITVLEVTALAELECKFFKDKKGFGAAELGLSSWCGKIRWG